MKQNLVRLKTLQIVLDVFLIFGVFLLSYLIETRFIGSANLIFSQYLIIALITTPITLWIMFFARSYTLNQEILNWRHVQRIAFLAVQNVAIFMVLYYLIYQEVIFSRWLIVYILVLTLLLLYLWHVIFIQLLKRSFRKQKGVFRTLIIGANRPAENIVKTLLAERSHIWPVAVINARGGDKKDLHGIPVVGKMDKFEQIIKDHQVDVILQVDHLEQSLNIINYALSNKIKYLMPPELLGVFQGHQVVEKISGLPFIKIHPKKHWWSSFW